MKTGGRYATHQDVAGLFFAPSVDLYLKDEGVIGFVLPHSALQAGQYSKWRGGQWRDENTGRSVQVDFTLKPAWDLERLEPNNFFPVPALVVFARKCPPDSVGRPLAGSVERGLGRAGRGRAARGPASARRAIPPAGPGCCHRPPLPVLRQRNGQPRHRAGGSDRSTPAGAAGLFILLPGRAHHVESLAEMGIVAA